MTDSPTDVHLHKGDHHLPREAPGYKKRRRCKKKPRTVPYCIATTSKSSAYHDDNWSGLGEKSAVEKNNNSYMRPRYSPKAPENYTQYIIGDQGDHTSYSDEIDIDLTSFLESQFECDFKLARAAELAQKSKSELTDLIHELETKAQQLTQHCTYCLQCHSNNNSDYDCVHDNEHPPSDVDEPIMPSGVGNDLDSSLSTSDSADSDNDSTSPDLYSKFLELQQKNAELTRKIDLLQHSR